MKRFARPLQAGNTVELHYNYAVNDEATDFPQGTDFIIAIYNINRRCLFDASLSNGGIVKGENTGEYVLTMNFEDTVNMPCFMVSSLEVIILSIPFLNCFHNYYCTSSCIPKNTNGTN